MKILAVSDRVLDRLYHGHVREKYPGVDLLLGCGDLPYYYLDFLTSAFDRRLFYVKGNHDHGPQYTADGRILKGVRGGVDLHGKLAEVDGLLLAGLQGSMRYRPQGTLMYTETEMRLQATTLLPGLLRNRMKHGRFLDILITHSPPHGIHDRPDLPHTGFRFFRTFMHLFQPRYLLHGHIHRYRHSERRVTRFEQTQVINVYPMYILHYPH